MDASLWHQVGPPALNLRQFLVEAGHELMWKRKTGTINSCHLCNACDSKAWWDAICFWQDSKGELWMRATTPKMWTRRFGVREWAFGHAPIHPVFRAYP
jgi:hypothetical protein